MGLKIDAKDFLTNMSAIKQRSMFAAEKEIGRAHV